MTCFTAAPPRTPPEIRRTVGDEPVVLDERAFIEQEIEPFARREFALVVLGLDAGGTAPFL